MLTQLERLHDAKILVGSGGLGDALIILNKFTKIIEKFTFPPKVLKYYTDLESTAKLVRTLFSLNYLYVDVIVVTNLEHAILHAKSDPETFVLTTVWNGILDEADLAKGVFYSDEVAITPFFDINKLVSQEEFDGPDHFLLQLDAGMIFHNQRKHWESIDLAVSLGQKLMQRKNIKCAVIGKPLGLNLPPDFIDLSDIGLTSLRWIKTAKCAIVLSGFVTFACLMSGVKTIMKVENERVQSRWFGCPEWQKLIVPIDEIKTDINQIVSVFDATVQ